MALNDEAKISRAEFLGSGLRSAATLAGLGLFGSTFLRSALAAPAPIAGDAQLVVIFLRGGCDGLNLVCPISGEDRKLYEQERPNLKTPLDGPAAALPLDSRFGLHPRARGLQRLFQEKKLAIVHAAGLTANTRSHFDAQSYMELGNPDKKGGTSGWITRLLGSQIYPGLPAAAIGSLVPASLLDCGSAVSVSDLGRLNLAARSKPEDHQHALAALYESGNGFIQCAGRETLHSLQLLQDSLKNSTLKDIDYPKSDLANRLKTLSRLMRLELGIRVATIDMGGWDTHKYQGAGNDGAFANQVAQLSEALDAFEHDLQANAPKVHARTTVVVMTEFGRRLRENANRGTDHGHGGVFLAFGAGIKGGTVLGRWPGLATEKLYERADLAVANDFRQPLAEIVGSRFGVKQPGIIFPGYRAASPLGIASA